MRTGLALCLCLAVSAWIALAVEAKKRELLMVQTLSRHGSRAPDKIIMDLCGPVMNPDGQLSKRAAFLNLFGTGPGELTRRGAQDMNDVGLFLRERYEKSGFIASDYNAHSRDWEFIAREGSRQQRSMMGISLGIFPEVAVPISVTMRESDAVLGGPAPACGTRTAQMIVDWQKTEGQAMVRSRYEKVVKPIEALCNVSLAHNPVNAMPGGANPHAHIGDISDLMDALMLNHGGPLPISDELHADLTQLAFDLEQVSRFTEKRGPTMFAGEFPNHLLSAFEAIVNNGGVRPRKIPKMRLFSCSRELHYGLEHMLRFFNRVRIQGQPVGRILSGTTFIWELDSNYEVSTLYWNPGMTKAHPLLPRVALTKYRAVVDEHLNATGTWEDLCPAATDDARARQPPSHLVRAAKTLLSKEVGTRGSLLKSEEERSSARETGHTWWWAGIAVLGLVAGGVVRRSLGRRREYVPVVG